MKNSISSLRSHLGSKVRKLLPKVQSDKYWENRYVIGKTSGAGSYGRLAQFKADFINDFVVRHNVQSIVDMGSGDGAQLDLAKYPSYLGVDVSQTAVNNCREKFADKANFQFIHTSEWTVAITGELVLSLDVIYHIVENEIFEDYINRVFDTSSRFVIIYSSNKDSYGHATHVKHRKFSDWVARNRPQFELIETIKNDFPFHLSDPDNTSLADFFVYKRL